MKKILFLLAASLFVFQLTSFASIDVTSDTGIIKITPPGGGKAIIINPGQTIPTIADGSTIEVVTGSLTVATTVPSTVNLSAAGNTITLTPGSTVQIALNTNGAVKVSDSDGISSVKAIDGKISLLNPGNTIVLAGNSVKNAEGYTPPVNNPGPGINTQVQIDNGSKDISAQ